MITVITGPMGSGKSLELLRVAKTSELSGKQVRAFKPSNDSRTESTIETRFGNVSIPAMIIKFAHEINKFINVPSEVIIVDEAQFIEDITFVNHIVELSKRGHHVIIGGLNRDFLGRPFGLMPQFLALADEIFLLKGVCAVCGQPGTETQRLKNDNPEVDGPLVVCGNEKNINGIRYECRCSKCIVR